MRRSRLLLLLVTALCVVVWLNRVDVPEQHLFRAPLIEIQSPESPKQPLTVAVAARTLAAAEPCIPADAYACRCKDKLLDNLIAPNSARGFEKFVRGSQILPYSLCDSTSSWHQMRLGLNHTLAVTAASVYHVLGNENKLWHVDLLVYVGELKAPVAQGTHCHSHRVPLSPVCIFAANGRQASTQGSQQQDGDWKGMKLSCPVPDELKLQLSDAEFTVTISFPEFGDSALTLQICRQLVEPIEIAVCPQPLFNFERVNTASPGIFDHWIAYHTQLMGVGHMHVYDLDGSFAEAVKPWVKLGLVTYTPRFSLHPEYLHNYEGRKADYHGGTSPWGPYCWETFAEDQCMWNNRFRAKWIMVLHSLDNFVHCADSLLDAKANTRANSTVAAATGSGKDDNSAVSTVRGADCGSKPLLDVLSALDPELVHEIPVYNHPFGGLTQSGALTVLDAYRYRTEQPYRYNWRSTPIFNPRWVDFTNVHWSIVWPLHLKPIHKEHVLASVLRTNHYMDMFGVRPADNGPFRVEDDSITWAVPLLKHLISLLDRGVT